MGLIMAQIVLAREGNMCEPTNMFQECGRSWDPMRHLQVTVWEAVTCLLLKKIQERVTVCEAGSRLTERSQEELVKRLKVFKVMLQG